MILVILAVSLILRLIYISLPNMVWWDAAVYIGMGKFMFTHGAIGFWETFRPMVWPAILGSFWKIGIDPSVAGNLIEVATAVGTIYLVYKIGEKLYPRAGLYASTLLSFTGIYFFFTNVPITDIPSAFVITLAVWLFLNDRLYLAGLSIGLAFTLRFPQGIYLVVIGLCIVILNRLNLKKTLIEGSTFVLGFATITIPYLLINYILYHNPLSPIIMGNTVFTASPGQSTALFYYPWNLFLENPFYAVGIIAFLYFIYSYRQTVASKVRLVIVLSLVIVAGYFMHLDHQELRYAIAFLPFVALCSGFGLSVITQKFSIKINNIIVACIGLSLILGGFFFAVPSWQGYSDTGPLNAYYAFLANHPYSRVVATTPQVAAPADINLVQVIDTWESAAEALPRVKNNVDFIALNSCQIQCSAGSQCPEAKDAAEAEIKTLTPVFATSTLGCDLTIYTYQPSTH